MHSASKNQKDDIAKRMGAFLRQYKRRAHPGHDPNDRQYDREIERYLRRLKPEDLDVLLNGDLDERFNLTNEETHPPPSLRRSQEIFKNIAHSPQPFTRPLPTRRTPLVLASKRHGTPSTAHRPHHPHGPRLPTQP